MGSAGPARPGSRGARGAQGAWGAEPRAHPRPRPALSRSHPHSLHPKVSLQGEFQRKLYKELIKNYNPLERPVANDSQPLTVYFSLSLLQIMDVVSLRGTPGVGVPTPAGAGGDLEERESRWRDAGPLFSSLRGRRD